MYPEDIIGKVFLILLFEGDSVKRRLRLHASGHIDDLALQDRREPIVLGWLEMYHHISRYSHIVVVDEHTHYQSGKLYGPHKARVMLRKLEEMAEYEGRDIRKDFPLKMSIEEIGPNYSTEYPS